MTTQSAFMETPRTVGSDNSAPTAAPHARSGRGVSPRTGLSIARQSHAIDYETEELLLGHARHVAQIEVHPVFKDAPVVECRYGEPVQFISVAAYLLQSL